MASIDKLIEIAINRPQNLRFEEFCTLCRQFEMEERKSRGSHKIFKRKTSPKFSISIQDDGGKAKPYQVRQFLNKLSEHNLYDFGGCE